MDTTTQNTQNASPPPRPIPVDINLPANDDTTTKSHAASKNDAVFTEIMSNTLEQILDVLQESTIAGERGKDVKSKFWATYKKVSNEYDDDFLERANDDMSIILTFAGLFSAVNSTFIVGMQPNPGDTTNALMVQLIQVVANGPDAVNNISNLSSSTDYTSSSAWMQTIAYASLAFSVLAAFGAVMGKQWLNSYKAARGRGSLEERGLRRQRKLNELERWHLQAVLGTFLVLLQISLFLFGLSLSAHVWMQKATMASVIICTTAFGVLFYGITVFISLLYPDSPFKSPVSHVVHAVCREKPTSNDDMYGRSSAIRWILETSTNPEVVAAAAAMIPLVQWSPKVDISAAYARLLDTFTICRHKSEPYVKAMAHLWTQPVKIDPCLIKYPISSDAHGRLIRDAFTSGRDAWDQFTVAEEKGARRKHKADVRTALRTMAVYGRSDRLSLPDDESLIWHGDLRWRHCNGLSPSCADFDWLVDYLDKVDATDDATEGDALLALSAMHKLGSPVKRGSYIKVLIRCLGPTRPSRVRHAALRAISGAREDLASITSDSMPQGVDAGLLDGLSHALLAAVIPDHTQSTPSGHVLVHENKNSDFYYFRLLFALAANDEWRQRLSCHGHVKWCISLVDLIIRLQVSDCNFYLAGIFSRIYSLGGDDFVNPRHAWWRTLMSTAWIALDDMEGQDIYGCIDALPALVEATRQSFQDWDNGLPSWEFDWQPVAESVQRVLVHLRTAVGQADEGLVNAALSTVQGLYDDLYRIIGHLKGHA